MARPRILLADDHALIVEALQHRLAGESANQCHHDELDPVKARPRSLQ